MRTEEQLRLLQAAAGGSADLITTRAEIGGIPCAVITCEGMISAHALGRLVLEPLMRLPRAKNGNALLEHIRRTQMLSVETVAPNTPAQQLQRAYAGFAVLLAEDAGFSLAFGIQGYAVRGISEPSGELNIYGSKEGFTEQIRTNMSLIRRRMRSPALVFRMLNAGSISRTDICLCYLRDRVPEGLPEALTERLEHLPLETVLSSGYIRPFLEPESLIHAAGTTERPDILCAKLLEGRVGILTDGTPFALTVPQLFCETFQTLDDYNYPPAYATLLRWLKYTAALVSLLLPACYIASALWHPELLHETLLRLLTESEQNVPFSLPAEMLGVLLMFEIVREAGLRLPKAVGGAVGMIGGLILGDSAVQSGLISTPVLTAAALAATAGFVIPEHHAALAVLRPALVLAAAAGGLPAVGLVCGWLLVQICGASAYGFPVSAPAAPLLPKRLYDVLVRQGFRKLANSNFNVKEVRNPMRNS